jgi:chemotaxis protein methyltransferase CheR
MRRSFCRKQALTSSPRQNCRYKIMTSESRTQREYDFSVTDFERVRKLIYARAGISLNATKQNMVYSRLSRRLRALDMDSFSAYLDGLEAGESHEWQEFVNALTTNLTSFFREAHHFPVLHERVAAIGREPLRIWCAAASTGEEPYSIAMTATEARPVGAPRPLILATDIDTNVLATARRGVYREDALKNVSPEQRRRFFLRGRDANAGMVRVRPELSALIEFKPLNLLSPKWPMSEPFDIIFCRNVMIYFDKPTQR